MPLLGLHRNYSNAQEYTDKLKTYVEKIRKEHKRKKEQKIRSNLTYINKKRVNKVFQPGDIVLLQNLHLTANRGVKAASTPGVVLEICSSGKSALVQSLLTSRVVKYSFSYLKKMTKPMFAQLPELWQRKVTQTTQVPPIDFPSQGTEADDSQDTQRSGDSHGEL